MIVYNVGRRFFAMKAEADGYRKDEGLKPAALLTLRIENREELAALLDGLCRPPPEGEAPPPGFPAPATLLDSAFVDPNFKPPDFIRESLHAILHRPGAKHGGTNQ